MSYSMASSRFHVACHQASVVAKCLWQHDTGLLIITIGLQVG